tara:strand:- start:213 stop:347 length:135 start_codon:yes stop_codon:yes gene_type:complete
MVKSERFRRDGGGCRRAPLDVALVVLEHQAAVVVEVEPTVDVVG